MFRVLDLEANETMNEVIEVSFLFVVDWDEIAIQNSPLLFIIKDEIHQIYNRKSRFIIFDFEDYSRGSYRVVDEHLVNASELVLPWGFTASHFLN